jgi:hypothetical protein
VAPQEKADEPDDPFLGKSGCCPHCGAVFPSASSDEIGEWAYGYAVDLGGGRAGVQGGTIFRSRCGACGTPVWAPNTGRRTWAECDPPSVVWYRDRNAHLTSGG